MAHEYLKFFHLIFAFVMVGGIVLAIYGTAKAVKTEDPDQFEGHLKAGETGGKLASVGLIAVSIFGVLTAWKQGWPLTSTGWLNATYVSVFIGGIVMPMAFDMRNAKKVKALMPKAREAGKVLPEQVRILAGPAARLTGVINMGILIFIVVLMVFKPF